MKRKVILIIVVFLFNIFFVNAIEVTNKLASKYNIVINTNTSTKLSSNPTIIDDLDAVLESDLSYNNESADKIGDKINLYLKDEMAGYGDLISKYAIANKVDPYVVASIIIESTKCDNKCSVLLTKCNNVSEAKYDKNDVMETSCFGGDYQKFDSIDVSIKSLVKFIKTNYYDNDMKTVNSFYSAFGKDTRWLFIINQYVDQIKNSEV